MSRAWTEPQSWALRAWTRATLVAAWFALTVGPADATGICVTCDEPDATYHCDVENPQGTVRRSGLAIACSQYIAKSNGHRSCRVRSGDGACDATLVLLPADIGAVPLNSVGFVIREPNAALPAAPSVAQPQAASIPQEPQITAPQVSAPSVDEPVNGTGTASSSAQPEVKPNPVTPPKTLAEATARAIEDTGKAATNAWTCLASLFQTCE